MTNSSFSENCQIRLCIWTHLILTWFLLCHKYTAALKQVVSCLVSDANWMQGSQHLISLITMVGPLQFDWWSFLFIPKNFFCPNTLLPSIKDSLDLFDKLCRFIIIHKILLSILLKIGLNISIILYRPFTKETQFQEKWYIFHFRDKGQDFWIINLK